MNSNFFRIDILSKKNQHPLQAASALSGEVMTDITLHDPQNPTKGKFSPPTSQFEVAFKELTLPKKGDPLYEHLPTFLQIRPNATENEIFRARNTLWLKVFIQERRIDSQFARHFQMDLPAFFSHSDSVECLRNFSSFLLSEGIINDISIHVLRDASGNIVEQKAQSLALLRSFSNRSFTNKIREWNDRNFIFLWRSFWMSSIDQKLNGYSEHSQYASWKQKVSRFARHENKEIQSITKQEIQEAFFENDNSAPSLSSSIKRL